MKCYQAQKWTLQGLCVGQPSKRLSQQVFQSLDEPVRSMGQWDQKSAKIPLGDDGRRIWATSPFSILSSKNSKSSCFDSDCETQGTSRSMILQHSWSKALSLHMGFGNRHSDNVENPATDFFTLWICQLHRWNFESCCKFRAKLVVARSARLWTMAYFTQYLR